MTASTLDPPRSRRRVGTRLLRSPLVDLLLGPHGVDRYLELIRPSLTVGDARAEVTAVRHQTLRSVTLTLCPNAAWAGFRAGQFVRAGFELDGVRRTRTYSPAGSQHAGHAELELTVTAHPRGAVSTRLGAGCRPGSIVHLAAAQGDFVLPDQRPGRLVLISGGSGVTPVMAMLRSLVDEEHDGEITFLHYARTPEDWLYETEVRELAARARGQIAVAYRATRGPDASGRLDADRLAALTGDLDDAHAAVCGPPALLEAARTAWVALGGDQARLLTETFTAPRLSVTGAAADGTLRFLRSNRRAPIGTGTLLEQAEAAGLTPDFGCRMGICRTCKCRKSAGAVRNLVTGEVSAEEDEDIQLCVSVPAGDVALEL
ncbi:MAG: ferredoxin reductase [Solirubrobacteraceae bacterium]